MKYCSRCNREFPDTSRFCPECGADLAAGAAADVTAGGYQAAENSAPNNFRAESFRTESAQFTSNPAIDRQMERQIENHLVKAIFATLCCCMPFGVAAIVFASQVNSKVKAGDWDGAVEAGKKANLWANLSIGIGALVNLLAGLFTILLPLLAGQDIFADL